MNSYVLKAFDGSEEELTCDDSYFKYCLYKEKGIARWKENFDKEDDLILYKERREEE